MKKKWIIRAAVITGSTILALLVVLFVHIYMVTRPNTDSATNNWQLGRIDFEQTLNSEEAILAKTAMKQIPGIQHVYVNNNHGTLVYSYNLGEKTNDEVFAEFSQKTSFKIKPYESKNPNGAEGCPVLDKSSLTYRVGNFFQNVIQ